MSRQRARRFPPPGLPTIGEVSPRSENLAECNFVRNQRSWLPRPSPAGSLVESPTPSPRRSMSPYSPQAAESRIPRLFRSTGPGLNTSFTLPDRPSPTLTPSPPRRPIGFESPPQMSTSPPRIRQERLEEGTPTGRPQGGRTSVRNQRSLLPRPSPAGSPVESPSPSRRRAMSPYSPQAAESRIPRLFRSTGPGLNTSFTLPDRQSPTPPQMSTSPPRIRQERLEEGTPTGRPQERGGGPPAQLELLAPCDEEGDEEEDVCEDGDEDPANTTFESYHTAADESEEDDVFEMTEDGYDHRPRVPRGIRRRWDLRQEEEERRITAGCLTTWGQRVSDSAKAQNERGLHKWAQRGTPQQSAADKSPTPSPGSNRGSDEEQSPCLDRLERIGISCTDGEGACSMAARPQNVQRAYYNDAPPCLPPPEEEEEEYEEEEECEEEEEDGGIYKYGLQPGESMEAYEARHQALIDQFCFPKPRLKPMPGTRVDPLPGEEPMEFIRRNQRAEEEWAAIAPPGMYTSARRPGESWEEWENRYYELIDQFSFPKPRLKPMPGTRVDPLPGEEPMEFIRRNQRAEEEWAAIAPPGMYTSAKRPGESWEEWENRYHELIREMYLNSKRSDERMAQQMAMASLGAPSPGPSSSQGPYPSTSRAYPSTSGPYPSTSGPYPSTSQAYPSTSGPYPSTSQAYPSTSQAYPSTSQAYPSTSQAYPSTSQAYPSTSGGCTSGAGPPTPRRSPRSDEIRRRAIETSQRQAGVRQHGRRTNEDFFGVWGDVAEDMGAPSTSQPSAPRRTSRRPAGGLSTINEVSPRLENPAEDMGAPSTSQPSAPRRTSRRPAGGLSTINEVSPRLENPAEDMGAPSTSQPSAPRRTSRRPAGGLSTINEVSPRLENPSPSQRQSPKTRRSPEKRRTSPQQACQDSVASLVHGSQRSPA